MYSNYNLSYFFKCITCLKIIHLKYSYPIIKHLNNAYSKIQLTKFKYARKFKIKLSNFSYIQVYNGLNYKS